MAKPKNKSKKKAETTDAPQIISTKGGLNAAQLVKETVFLMEDGLRINMKQARDFSESMAAAIENALAEGKPVNIAGIVKLTPRLHTKGQREVNVEFGNPDSGKTIKKYPAKVSVKPTVLKRAKEALPTVQKMQKALGR